MKVIMTGTGLSETEINAILEKNDKRV